MLQLETVAMKESRTKESAIINQLQADVNELKKKNHELTMTVQRIEQDLTSAKSTITAIRRENSEALKNIDCQHCDLNTSKLKKLEHDVTKINTHILNIFPKKQRSVSNPEQNTSAKDGKYSVTVDKTVPDNQTKHCDTEPSKQNTIKVPAAPEISHKNTLVIYQVGKTNSVDQLELLITSCIRTLQDLPLFPCIINLLP